MSFVEIFDCNFDFGEFVEDVKFREIDGCVAVDLVGIT